jgi:hypothetical protein
VKECRAEDLQLDDKVDVIVSEWMGYFLLFENMLPSVLSVRDKYLRPGGLMLPSQCRLKIAPIEDRSWRGEKLEYWKSVRGIDMSALIPLATATACEKGQHHRVKESDLLLDSAIEVLSLDLHTVTEADLGRFERSFSFELPAGRLFGGFVSWFECEFGEAGWLLSTGPAEECTHWRQTAFHFRQPIASEGGLTVDGSMVVERHEAYTRGYNVTFDVKTSPGFRRRTEKFELR